MQRPSTSTERTPLMQPSYAFEASLSRRYHKRLQHMQCVICVTIMVILAVALLVTVSYSLSDDDLDNSTSADNDTEPIPTVPLSLTLRARLHSTSPALQPFINNTWPLKDKPSPTWNGKPPTKQEITKAVLLGKAALKELTKLEYLRKPLVGDSPANRAQRAAATGEDVKPMADAAYAVEVATKALMNSGVNLLRGLQYSDGQSSDGSPTSRIGIGPPINGSFPEPRYCITLAALPSCALSKYRTQDGSCNNLNNPYTWGVSHTPFRRVLPANYGDGVSSPRTGADGNALPSARDVSVTVHRPSYAHDSSFTVMLAVWGQFLDHDITATALSKGQNSSALSCCDPTLPWHPECFPVQLDEEDPFYQDYNLTCMEFVRSAPAPTCHFGSREQLNQATAFIDASVVYGFAESRTSQLRLGSNGEMKMLKIGSRTLLPPSTDPNDGCNTAEMNAMGRYCFETGDERANENLHLTTMHLILTRQHNRIAAILNATNPTWDDDTVFQETRRIIGAQMQHITYSEFLPAILGEDVMFALNMTLRDEGFSDHYNASVDPSIANHFAAAAFRFAHTLLPGLIHNTDSNNGTVNYIHLHQMLFNPYALYTDQGTKNAVQSAMDTLVHTVDPHVTTELSNHLFENPQIGNVTTTTTKPTGPCGLDLVSLNIQRGRDHGLPSYPEWREHCGLSRPRNLTELSAIFDASSWSRIGKIYSNVDDIDLYTGALAEEPQGRLLGPTLSCLIADQFLRLKIGDRFWYETSDTTVGFTLEQLTEIRKTTLSGIICANEGLLDQAQARVMEAISPTNPLVDCMELPQPSFEPWYNLDGSNLGNDPSKISDTFMKKSSKNKSAKLKKKPKLNST